MSKNDSVSPRSRLAVSLAFGGLAVALALAIYRPWQSLPFDVLDFSEFLPLLQRENSFDGRFLALAEYYGTEHGRFNVLPYVLTAAKWTLFGDHPAIWQVVRFSEMVCACAGSFFLLNRLGITSAAAALPALLYVTAGTAAPSWLRLTVAEPFGTILLLIAAFLASGYAEAEYWKRRAVLIAVLLGACVWTKEMLVAAVPFVLLLASLHRSGTPAGGDSQNGRRRWLIFVTSIAIAAASVPVVALALRAPAQGFASMYGEARASLPHFLLNLLLFGLPEAPILFPGNIPSYILSNYLFVSIVLLGHWQMMRHGQTRRPWLALSGVALTLPLTAAVIYLPWPQIQPFYGLPFLLGPVILLAQALAVTERGPRMIAWLCRGVCGLIIFGTATTSQRLAVLSFAQRDNQYKVAKHIAEAGAQDSILYAVRKKPLVPWEGPGPTLRRYAAVVFGHPSLPPAIDIPCADAHRLESDTSSRVLLISVSYECGSLRTPTYIVTERFRYLTWPRITLRPDSLRADLRLPANSR